MPFCIVGRDPATGEVRLVMTAVFEKRREALDAIAALPPEVSLTHADDDVFLIDLDKATPILLVVPTAPAAEVSAPAEPAAEPGVEPVEEPIAEAVLEEAQEGAGLADALSRAADRLESEGITAPESVGPPASKAKRRKSRFPELEAEAEVGPLVEAYVPELAALVEESAVVVPAPLEDEAEAAEEPEPGSEPGPEPEAEPEAAVEEPATEVTEVAETAEVEAVPAEGEWEWDKMVAESAPEEGEAAPEQATASEFVPEGLEAPAAIAEPLIHTPDEELLEVGGRAVVMGEYADEPATAEPMSEAGAAAPAEPFVESASDEGSTSVAEPDLSLANQAYEATMAGPPVSEYSCEDCIYESTCPKKGAEDPATCGSFQWKAASFKWQD